VSRPKYWQSIDDVEWAAHTGAVENSSTIGKNQLLNAKRLWLSKNRFPKFSFFRLRLIMKLTENTV